MNADQLEGLSVCVFVCPKFSHRAQAHLALPDNTTGLLTPQRAEKSRTLLYLKFTISQLLLQRATHL